MARLATELIVARYSTLELAKHLFHSLTINYNMAYIYYSASLYQQEPD